VAKGFSGGGHAAEERAESEPGRAALLWPGHWPSTRRPARPLGQVSSRAGGRALCGASGLVAEEFMFARPDLGAGG